MTVITQLSSADENTVRDIEALQRELHLGSGSAPVTLERIREVLADQNAALMTAQDDGKIIGVATLYVLPKTTKRVAHIDDVVVLNDYRGKGLGRKLMEALIDAGRARGIDSIELTSRSSRIAAHKLYEKLGFEKRETDVFRLKLS